MGSVVESQRAANVGFHQLMERTHHFEVGSLVMQACLNLVTGNSAGNVEENTCARQTQTKRLYGYITVYRCVLLDAWKSGT